MKNLVLVVAFLMAGCASVIQANGNLAQVEHGNSPVGMRDAMKLANESCGQHKKIAVLDRQACHGARCTTQFRCEAS